MKEEEERPNLFFLFLHKLFSADCEQGSVNSAGDKLAPNHLDTGGPVGEDRHTGKQPCKIASGCLLWTSCLFPCSFLSLPQLIPKYFASPQLPLFHAFPIPQLPSLLVLTQLFLWYIAVLSL